jgi:hypothetical protein
VEARPRTAIKEFVPGGQLHDKEHVALGHLHISKLHLQRRCLRHDFKQRHLPPRSIGVADKPHHVRMLQLRCHNPLRYTHAHARLHQHWSAACDQHTRYVASAVG